MSIWSRVIAVAGAASLVGALAAKADTVELTFRQFDPPGEIGGLVAAVDAWNASHKDIHITLQTVTGGDAQAQYVREVPAGGGPDIEHLAFVWTRDLGRSKLLLPLDDLIKANPPGAGIDDFLALDLAKFEGKTFGVPWTADTIVLAYRPDLLQKAGITSFPDTWDDFQAAARKLSSGNQYGFCFPGGSGPDGGMWFLANYYLWSNGTTLLQETSPGKWELGTTAADVARAMTYFNGFFTQHATPESLIAINSWGDPEIVGGIARGDCAISFFPPQTLRAAQAQSKSPLMTAMIPKGSKTRISHLGGRALGINPNSKHVPEAWQFIRYLVSADTFKTYNQYPAQKSILKTLNFPAAEKGYVDMLPQAITFERYISSPVRVTSMQTAVNKAFGSVYSGQRKPEEAADAFITELKGLLARGPN